MTLGLLLLRFDLCALLVARAVDVLCVGADRIAQATDLSRGWIGLAPLATDAPALLHLGLYGPVLLALYLLALRSVFAHQRANGDEAARHRRRPRAGKQAAPRGVALAHGRRGPLLADAAPVHTGTAVAAIVMS